MNPPEKLFAVYKETPLVFNRKRLTTYVLRLSCLVLVGWNHRPVDVGVNGPFLVIHPMVVDEATITTGADAIFSISCKEHVLK